VFDDNQLKQTSSLFHCRSNKTKENETKTTTSKHVSPKATTTLTAPQENITLSDFDCSDFAGFTDKETVISA
jgi:hypothetical protein